MDTQRTRSFWARRRVLLALAAALAAVSIISTSFSLGLWTDQATVGGNTFTAGTIDISTSPASAVIGLSPMMPGDTVNGTLTVNNAGTAQLRYALTSSSTNADAKALRDGITLTVKLRDVAADACVDFDGTSLYTGTLAAAAFGSNAVGPQAGDRTLNGAASEKLCLRATLPITAANSYQGGTTTTTFTFDAEQTANNP
jgi:predicted ribosomally synthesized peptide with SipW-like signal peptide